MQAGETTGENEFDNFNISLDDATLTMASGFEIARTTSSDEGGNHFKNVRITRSAGTITNGFNFHSTQADTFFGIFMEDSVADNINGGDAMRFSNATNIQMTTSWFTSSGGYGIGISGGHDFQLINNYIGATSGGINLTNSPISLIITGNRITTGIAFNVDAANPPSNVHISGNNLGSTSAISNNNKVLTDSTGTFVSTAFQVLTDPTQGANQSLGIIDMNTGATNPNKYLRSNNGSLEVLNSAFSQTIFSLSDNGNLTIPGGLNLSGNFTQTGATTLTTGTGLTTLGGNAQINGTRFYINGFDGSNNFWFGTNGSEPGSLFVDYIGTAGGNAQAVNIAPGGGIKLYVNSSGSVGIGTNAPLATLDVRGNTQHLPIASFSGQTNYAALVTNNDGAGDLFTASASGSTRFTVKNNGDLSIYGNRFYINGYDTTNNFWFRTNTPTLEIPPDALYLSFISTGGANTVAKAVNISPGGGYKLYVDNTGGVGIGTGTPSATLDVRGNGRPLAIASISGSTSFAALVTNNDGAGDLFTASQSGWTRFVIKGNGDTTVGGNLQLNGQRFYVNGFDGSNNFWFGTTAAEPGALYELHFCKWS